MQNFPYWIVLEESQTTLRVLDLSLEKLIAHMRERTWRQAVLCSTKVVVVVRLVLVLLRCQISC